MAYLFVHFCGENKAKEDIYFSVSQDGLHWQDLNLEAPALHSKLGTTGVRDPFIIKNEQTGKYYILATDLKMSALKDWEVATTKGSRSIIIWESDDLIHWSKERICEVGVEGAGCVWAPESIYDESKKAFLVFWASNMRVGAENSYKHIIYASYTKDFVTFSEPFVYIERESDIIDTTIVKENDTYYRFSKNEVTKCIEMEKGKSLDSASFKTVTNTLLDDLTGLEGPQCYHLEGEKWVLIVDEFLKGTGYKPILIESLETATMSKIPESLYDMGISRKRHGSVIKISDVDYQNLQQFYLP